ncbi:MAG: hypothetical protein IPP71_21635 [Bacteroidetes bacterium]|nr:hypothetical protein [Bacteroidota bacterium]
MYTFSLIDYLYGPLALILIVVSARLKKYRKVEKFPEYQYFTKGLYVKLFGGVSVCIIYALYYGGGDTIIYFNDASCMMRLLFSNPSGFFAVMTDGLSINNYFYFNDQTGFPVYFRDSATFYVVRIATPFVILGAGSFIVATMLFAYASYAGIWKLYQLFVMEFPALKKEMAFAILFIPSVFFWGSGILKDTITMSCIGYYSYSFYMIFIKRQKLFGNMLAIFIASYFIIMIKPYIIFALLPGSIIWFVNRQIGSIQNSIIKFLFGPFMFSLAIAGGYFLLINLGDLLGGYAVDKVLEKAVVTYTDLKADYYAGNSFDIGEFEATIPSMLAKAPAAINAALFRPYLTEAKNIVMVLSALEGTLILLLTLRILIRLRIIGIFPIIFKNHLLSFSLIFSLFFAFSVGISTSNFGSLVRYRIPVLPFFVACLFIMDYYYKIRNDVQKPIEENLNSQNEDP